MKIKAKAVPHKNGTIIIKTDFIQLDSLLKFEGIAETGGHAKVMIKNNEVRVNNEVCTARGKKIKENDVVTVDNVDYTIKKEQI